MSYKIDPYFSEAKLLIECNKYDHKYKDIGNEINQQTFTEDQLKCIFIRYCPELKNLTTERGLNRIFNTTFTPNFLVSRKLHFNSKLTFSVFASIILLIVLQQNQFKPMYV